MTWGSCADIESREGVRRGDRVWQIAFGSGLASGNIWTPIKLASADTLIISCLPRLSAEWLPSLGQPIMQVS